MSISATLGTVRYYTKDDPYFYTVDNRPLQDLAANDVIVCNTLDSILAGTTPFNSISTVILTSTATQIRIFSSSSLGEHLRIGNNLATVNYVSIIGGIASSPAQLGTGGNDVNVGLNVFTKGAGDINFITNTIDVQLKITATNGAVNYLAMNGASSGNAPNFTSTGSDTNVDLNLNTKGTGSIRLATNTGQTQLLLTNTSSSVNFIQITGAIASGAGPLLSVGGTDTNAALRISSKGTGVTSFFGGTTNTEQVRITPISAALNYVRLTGATVGTSPLITSGGADANPGLIVSSFGTGNLDLATNSGTAIQARITHTATAANYLALTGAASLAQPTLSVGGTDTDISLTILAKGVGSINLGNPGGTVLTLSAIASTVNKVTITGGTSGNAPSVAAISSSDTNVGITIASQGTGSVNLSPGTGDIRWNKALVALGAGAAPTFGTIGGSGPATAAQNTWLRVLDSTGTACWLPVWK